jgi:hypothetical protein
MALTVGTLREILKDTTIDDALPVAFVHWTGNREIAESAWGSAIIERDNQSKAPLTGRVQEPRGAYRKGTPERIFALYDK